MPCSICGRAEGASTPRCPHCPPDNSVTAPNANTMDAKDAVVTLVPTEGAQSTQADPSATAPQDAAVDPEVLPPDGGHDLHRDPFARTIFSQETGQHGGQTAGQSQNSSFRFAVWHGFGSGGTGGFGGMGGPGGQGSFGGMGMGRSSCLPGCITLFLTLVCAVQFGVLAALGFVIFHLMGSGAVLALNLQQVMQGRPAYWGLDFGPWLGRILVWGGSWALAGWLSDGF